MIGAGIGVATNVATSRWSWAWGAGLIALVLSAVAIQVALSLGDRRSERPRQGGSSTVAIGRDSYVVGDHGIVGGGDVKASISTGVSGLHLTLVIAVVGLIVLGVVVVTVPGRGVSLAARPVTSAAVPVTGSPAAGAPLRLTLTGLDNECHRVLLPESIGDAARQFTSITAQPADPDAFMRRELDTGGYAHRSVVMRLDAQSPLPQQVTVTDVKLVDVAAAAPIRGAFVNLQTCGGDEINAMVIHVNAPDTKPFAVDDESHETDRHFFDSQVVNVAPGQKQSFAVRVVVDPDRTAGSYTFRLGLTYEVDGAMRTAVIDDHGHPFRLTGGCDVTTALEATGPTNQEIQHVDASASACAH